MTKQLFHAICVLLRGGGKLTSRGAAKPNVSPLPLTSAHSGFHYSISQTVGPQLWLDLGAHILWGWIIQHGCSTTKLSDPSSDKVFWTLIQSFVKSLITSDEVINYYISGLYMVRESLLSSPQCYGNNFKPHLFCDCIGEKSRFTVTNPTHFFHI